MAGRAKADRRPQVSSSPPGPSPANRAASHSIPSTRRGGAFLCLPFFSSTWLLATSRRKRLWETHVQHEHGTC